MTAQSQVRPVLLHLLAAAVLAISLAACSEPLDGPSTTESAEAGAAADADADAGTDTGAEARRGGNPPSTPPPPLSNTVRWSTASEVGNYGFDVYRADSADGPFERLTEQPIAGAGTTDLPSAYAYVDDAIEPGREYYYYVESISLEGERSRFTPVRRAPPKSAAEGEPEQ